jgi:hypothetical protein
VAAATSGPVNVLSVTGNTRIVRTIPKQPPVTKDRPGYTPMSHVYRTQMIGLIQGE